MKAKRVVSMWKVLKGGKHVGMLVGAGGQARLMIKCSATAGGGGVCGSTGGCQKVEVWSVQGVPSSSSPSAQCLRDCFVFRIDE